MKYFPSDRVKQLHLGNMWFCPLRDWNVPHDNARMHTSLYSTCIHLTYKHTHTHTSMHSRKSIYNVFIQAEVRQTCYHGHICGLQEILWNDKLRNTALDHRGDTDTLKNRRWILQKKSNQEFCLKMWKISDSIVKDEPCCLNACGEWIQED